jgi:hypothetical protein
MKMYNLYITIPNNVKTQKLQSGQLVVLDLLYKFRFASIDLLQATLNTKHNLALYNRLKILVNNEYVGKRYKPSDRYKRVKAT